MSHFCLWHNGNVCQTGDRFTGGRKKMYVGGAEHVSILNLPS